MGNANTTAPASNIPEKPPGAPRFVQLDEAIKYAKVGRSHLYKLIQHGKIDARKDGRRTLVDLNSIDAYHRSLPRVIINRRR